METRNSQCARCEMTHLVNAARAESGARMNSKNEGEGRGDRPVRWKTPKGHSAIGSTERARRGEGRLRRGESCRVESRRNEEEGRGESDGRPGVGGQGDEWECGRAGRSEFALLRLLERLATAVEALELVGRLLRQEFHEVLHLALALRTHRQIS